MSEQLFLCDVKMDNFSNLLMDERPPDLQVLTPLENLGFQQIYVYIKRKKFETFRFKLKTIRALNWCYKIEPLSINA